MPTQAEQCTVIDGEDASSVYRNETESSILDSAKVLQFRKSLSMAEPTAVSTQSTTDMLQLKPSRSIVVEFDNICIDNDYRRPLLGLEAPPSPLTTTSIDHLTGRLGAGAYGATASAAGSN